jgi:hypothetical protein
VSTIQALNIGFAVFSLVIAAISVLLYRESSQVDRQIGKALEFALRTMLPDPTGGRASYWAVDRNRTLRLKYTTEEPFRKARVRIAPPGETAELSLSQKNVIITQYKLESPTASPHMEAMSILALPVNNSKGKVVGVLTFDSSTSPAKNGWTEKKKIGLAMEIAHAIGELYASPSRKLMNSLIHGA